MLRIQDAPKHTDTVFTFILALISFFIGVIYLKYTYTELSYGLHFDRMTARTEGTVTKFANVITRGYSPVKTEYCPVVEWEVKGEHQSQGVCGALRVKIGQKFPVAYDPDEIPGVIDKRNGGQSVVHPWFGLPYTVLNNIYKGIIFFLIGVALIILRKKVLTSSTT